MIELNSLYKHYKNGNNYETVSFCKMQTNNIWMDAILYKASDGNLYVRTITDFIDKFKKVD